MIAVATTVFVSGFAWAQELAIPGKEKRFDVFSQSTVVNGLPAFFGGLNSRSRILHHSGINVFMVFNATVFGPEFNDQYSASATLSPSGLKVSNQLDRARLQVQDMPVDLVRCNLDFTICESFPGYTTADVDIVAVGEGEVFEEMFGPDLTCLIQPVATATGSIDLETGINLFGENPLGSGMSKCEGNIEI
jgi:hypothetical protein